MPSDVARVHAHTHTLIVCTYVSTSLCLSTQAEEEGNEDDEGEEGEEQEEQEQQAVGGAQDPWEALLTVLPQQWHQAFNLLRVCGWGSGRGGGGAVGMEGVGQAGL